MDLCSGLPKPNTNTIYFAVGDGTGANFGKCWLSTNGHFYANFLTTGSFSGFVTYITT